MGVGVRSLWVARVVEAGLAVGARPQWVAWVLEARPLQVTYIVSQPGILRLLGVNRNLSRGLQDKEFNIVQFIYLFFCLYYENLTINTTSCIKITFH